MESSTFGRSRCSTAMDGVSPGLSQLVSGDDDLPSSARSRRFVIPAEDPRGGRTPTTFFCCQDKTAVACANLPTPYVCPLVLCMFNPRREILKLLRHVCPLVMIPLSPNRARPASCNPLKWRTERCTRRSLSRLPAHFTLDNARQRSRWYARVPAVCASARHPERDSEGEGHTLVRGARQVSAPSYSFCRPCCSFSSDARRLKVPTHEQLD